MGTNWRPAIHDWVEHQTGPAGMDFRATSLRKERPSLAFNQIASNAEIQQEILVT